MPKRRAKPKLQSQFRAFLCRHEHRRGQRITIFHGPAIAPSSQYARATPAIWATLKTTPKYAFASAPMGAGVPPCAHTVRFFIFNLLLSTSRPKSTFPFPRFPRRAPNTEWGSLSANFMLLKIGLASSASSWRRMAHLDLHTTATSLQMT